jgi:hypothetical protein
VPTQWPAATGVGSILDEALAHLVSMRCDAANRDRLAMLAAMRLAAGLYGETPAAIIDIVFAGCGRADGVRSCAVRVPIYKICGHP